MLHHIIRIIQNNSDPESLLYEIAKTIGEYLSLDGCFIVAGTSNQTKNHLAYWMKNHSIKIFPQSLNSFFTHLALKNKSSQNWPIIIDQDEDFPFNPLAAWKSLLVNRLIFRGNVNGFILLGHEDDHTWTAEELQQLDKLDSLLSIACHIVQPSPTLRQSLLKKWYKETQEQISNKKNLLDLQEQIITMLSDRIRNPLTAIKMSVELLENSTEQDQRYWNILKQSYAQIEELFKSITTLRSIQTQELTFKWELVALNLFLEEITTFFQIRWQKDTKKQLELILYIEPTIEPILLYTDSGHLKSILVELLTNAENFSTNQSQVHVKVSENTNQVKIEVTNCGLMISPEEFTYIFEPFRRGKEAIEKSIPGIGIGLTLVKGLVDYLGGRIEVNSDSINSNNLYLNSFILSFPQ